jgi:hypothetical protein
MSLNVGMLVSQLRGITVPELRCKYAELFGEEARSHHKSHLIRRIAWRMQALAEGDLPERSRHIRERASEIANDADLRTRAPAPGTSTATKATSRATTTHIDVPADARLPMPGALLTRQYRGRTIHVRVLRNGFDHEGTVYRSLSAVARAITGAHWNGYLFFGLKLPSKEVRQ